MIHIEYKLKKAADFEAQGKLLHAVQVYTDIINCEKNYSAAYIKLSAVFEKLDNYMAAVRLLMKFLDEVSEDIEVRMYLGQMLLKYSLWEEAIGVLSLITADELPSITFFIGYAYFQQKDYEIARINLLNFLNNNESNEFHFEVYLYLAKIDFELGLFEEALNYAKLSEELNAENWDLYLTLTKIYYSLGMYFHAVTSIEKALKRGEDKSKLIEWAGKAYLKLGDYKNAEKYLSQCIESAEASSEIYSDLALACMNIHKEKDAENYFNIAIKLNPDNQIAIEGKNKFKN